MQKVKQNIKQYTNDFKEIYDISSILKYAIILNIALFVIERSKLLQKVELEPLNIAIGVLLIMLVLVIIQQLHLIDSLKLKIVNNVDAVLLIILISSFIYFLISWVVLGFNLSRIFTCIFILVIGIVVLTCRIYLTCKQDKEQNKHTNIYTLKDLYDDNIDESEELILIDEDSADYDLLHREIFINNLYDIIVNCNPDKKFVIGLEGPWGSGKTTILNIVKKKIKDNNENIIIIDDFDPWSYDNKESLFIDMFDTILRKTGFKYSMSKSKNMINNLYSVLFSDEKRAKIKALGLYNEENLIEVNKAKSMINNYIKKSNKRIVFIIDNIDRAEKENVMLIFKLVNNIFDFKNITYILAFDDEQIKRIMKEDLNIDYNYLKKIVQLEIKLPKIDKEVKRNLIDQCIKNVIKLNTSDINELDEMIKHISYIVDDIRDLKRFINSAIEFTYRTNRFLNIIDILGIELIKIQNIKLYETIWKNKEYFISEDCYIYKKKGRLYTSDKDLEEFNNKGKELFDNIFESSENSKYINLLSDLFPNVERYNSKGILKDTKTINSLPKNKYREVNRRRSVCSGKFFEIYFVYMSNIFFEMSKISEKFINYINISQSIEEVSRYLELEINSIDVENKIILFQTMQFYINNLEDDKVKDLLYFLYNYITTNIFLDFRIQNVLNILIADILINISQNEFDLFMGMVSKDYKNISILKDINYWIINNTDIEQDKRRSRSEILERTLGSIVNEIYYKKINIYSNNNYRKNNLRDINELLQINKRDIKVFIKNVLNSNNIIKFLYDFIYVNNDGDRYSYSINKDEIEIFMSIEKVDELIQQREYNSEDEKFILNIYKNKKSTTMENEKYIYYYNHEIKLE
ncbi:P-loop NTPase fold protein [Intestinibacter bartlettii]|uniref:KAP family NTPase n=1 Tax=Intestinibacter bartlettii TaxID=261299 RepID=A0ABS6E0B4_9FIRM|nr:P-loop NTPase fold protein [Intestinibacter bartlettii]MBU5337530.1 KAP family NTPase [Intestinibacter bartlettii]